MKKLILAVLVVFVLAGCDTLSNRDTFLENDVRDAVAVETKGVVPEAVDIPDTPQAILDFLAEYKDTLETSATTETMRCTLSARGDSVVFTYTYVDLFTSSEEQRTQFSTALEESRESLLQDLNSMRAVCPQIRSLIYEYCETDGDIIASIEID